MRSIEFEWTAFRWSSLPLSQHLFPRFQLFLRFCTNFQHSLDIDDVVHDLHHRFVFAYATSVQSKFQAVPAPLQHLQPQLLEGDAFCLEHHSKDRTHNLRASKWAEWPCLQQRSPVDRANNSRHSIVLGRWCCSHPRHSKSPSSLPSILLQALGSDSQLRHLVPEYSNEKHQIFDSHRTLNTR